MLKRLMLGLLVFVAIATTSTVADAAKSAISVMPQGFDPVAAVTFTAQIEKTGIPDDVTNAFTLVEWSQSPGAPNGFPDAPGDVDFAGQGSTVTTILFPAEGVYVINLIYTTGRDFGDSQDVFVKFVRRAVVTVAPESERPDMSQTGFDGWETPFVCIAETGCNDEEITIFVGDGLGN